MPEPNVEDEVERLALMAAQGDQEALSAVLVAVQDRVLSRCQRALPNRADAEDASQEALLLVSRRISTFEGRSRFTTWLYRVTSSALLDTYRRLKRRAEDSGVDLDVVAARDRTSVLAGNRVDLLDAMEQVDGLFAEAVMLRDICQLNYKEIAAVLDIAEGTAKSRAHEGRRQLQNLLRERA